MTVTETKQGLGSWELRLRPGTPRSLLNRLGYLGHIAIVPGQLNVAQYGDALLSAARYVGVHLGKSVASDRVLRGAGMSWWLGDADGKGDVFETPVTLTAVNFAAAVTALLPPNGAITLGTTYAVAGTYTGYHQWQTSRKAINYVTGTFGAEWRVNGNGTLDAGEAEDLFDGPIAMIHRREPGQDLAHKALTGSMQLETDVEDLTTRVVLLAEGEGDAIATGSADATPTGLKDIHGNTIVITRLVSESDTVTANADVRAQLALSQFVNPRASVTLTTVEYDVKGDFRVGDWIYVHDPDSGFYDNDNDLVWEAEEIHPLITRVTEMQWPVRPGWTVAFRDTDGNWVDLSDYYAGETGETVVGVGDLPTSLATIGSEPVGSRPALDTSIPGPPAFTGFNIGTYQSGSTNTTKSAIRAAWTAPLNVDGSTILDGAHYEIRYRVSAVLGYRVKWGEVGIPSAVPYRWGELAANRWGSMVSSPVVTDPEWTTVYVPWGTNEYNIIELTPGVTYELQIRSVDLSGHLGPYSASSLVTTVGDLFAPSTPAAPLVASSLIALQVTHYLGKSSGGTFNLEQDLDHLEVHVGGSDSFYADDTTMVGKLIATSGMINAEIPAVQTYQVPQTDQVYVKVRAVDRSGNKSPASAGATATATLIDDSHIGSLTVSKVTAGTILADWILGASIKTATSGARVELAANGIRVYRADGAQTFSADSATGNVAIAGQFESTDAAGGRIFLGNQDAGQQYQPALMMYPNPAVYPGALPSKIVQYTYAGTAQGWYIMSGDPLGQSYNPSFVGVTASRDGSSGVYVNSTNANLDASATLSVNTLPGTNTGEIYMYADNYVQIGTMDELILIAGSNQLKNGNGYPLIPRSDIFSGSTDVNGYVTITHGCLTTPIAVICTPRSPISGANIFSQATADTITGTNFRVRCFSNVGSALASIAVTLSWSAITVNQNNTP